MNSFVLNIAALASLVPAALVPLRRAPSRDSLFWAVLALAVAGPVAWAAAQFGGSWRTDLGAALWAVVAVSVVLFGGIAVGTRQGWRLAPLLLPYLLVLGVFASLAGGTVGRPLMPEGGIWVEAHIFVGMVTFGFATMAAVAALAAFLQERALKRKRPTALTRLLPSVVDSERLTFRLLLAAEAVLGVGLITGSATLYAEKGRLLSLDHKTLLSLLAFAAIGALLLAQHRWGVRGKMAARAVLLAYLLLTLAYLGVKFVSQVLLG